ncbi:Putative transport protein YdiK [Candidatus Profftia lariciata]|uniref:AI-2E family transporter YdiK n=1 Tax=Candidatus Profftia lariciata TaxID=1987921 RepID=UPI001D023881|nr:AI-2E family transporter YdiK [Candidatus Profftia lariciata]UDG81313.1 Putative transport protein YdiK [Candidatus Profftia lariciata]
MYQSLQQNNLPRIIFGVLFISLMIVACLWIIKPFILELTWASIIVIATWHMLINLQNIFWGKRWIAVLLMTLLLFLFLIIPITLIISSLINNSKSMLVWASSAKNWSIPDLLWLQSIPTIGHNIYKNWHAIFTNSGSMIIAKIQPYIGQTITWFLAQAAHLGSFLLHCSLMLLFSALLYSKGENVALGIRHFAIRLGSDRGDAVIILAVQAIRSVALCIVITALVQSILGGIGLAISGINYATLLTVFMFICCLAQLGPLLILIPAIVWLYWIGDSTHGTMLLIWSCIVGTLDNFLRPVLIRIGADLPMVLLLSGVIGGLLAFGMLGLFIGPVVLTVSYLLVSSWVQEAPKPKKTNNKLRHYI